MKLFFYYISYLYLPAAGMFIWYLLRRRRRLWPLWTLIFSALSVLAYARFIEPRLLNVQHTTIPITAEIDAPKTVRLLVFSDMHIGLFGNAMSIDRIVRKAKTLDFDAVLIPGDLSYYLKPENIKKTFAPLQQLETPVFVVLGNHDVGIPGPDLGMALTSSLDRMENVRVIHNRTVELNINGVVLDLMGTSDLWQRQYSFPESALKTKPLIILTHNPDMAQKVPPEQDFDLLVAGHTHGGQVRIPFLYQRAIPTRYPYDKGLHHVPLSNGEKQVFVTPGTGMIGLPLRFLMPPQLDVVTLEFSSDR